MRVAALCDVHGNLPALEAVLAEVTTLDVDRIVCGGDVVTGPFPSDCLDLQRERDALIKTLLEPPDPVEVSAYFESLAA